MLLQVRVSFLSIPIFHLISTIQVLQCDRSDVNSPVEEKHWCLFISIFRWMVDIVFIILASCSLTLAHLLLPYDWPVWHHVTKHHTAISGVRSRHTEHFQNAHRRACWCQPLWHPSLFCHGKTNITRTWICCLINCLTVVTDTSLWPIFEMLSIKTR